MVKQLLKQDGENVNDAHVDDAIEGPFCPVIIIKVAVKILERIYATYKH